MENKKIPTDIINKVSFQDRALFLELWLSSDRAGIVANRYNGDDLMAMVSNGLIKVTIGQIVLVDYLSSNYGGTIKNNYNPHKPVLADISKAGFTYDPESNTIIIPTDTEILDCSSLNQALPRYSGTNTHNQDNNPLEVNNSVISFIQSSNFALGLSLLLMIGQTFHTANSLMSMASLSEPYNTIFAISSALLMDCLIIYFVSNGDKVNSLVFFIFCSLMNIYSYHHGTIEYFTYDSFFALVPALGIPFAVHAVSSKMRTSRELVSNM